MVAGSDLEKFQRVVVDQDICIECGTCVAVCPFQAFEFDEKNKSRLIWDLCQDDFSCAASCPVSCIYKAQDAPAEAKAKKGWMRLSRELDLKEKEILEGWRKKYQMTD